jgi:hypothetical protein
MTEWQPIETAPKGETVILLWCPESWDTDCVRIGFWSESDWYDDESASHPITDMYGAPTHWHPLPNPLQTTKPSGV